MHLMLLAPAHRAAPAARAPITNTDTAGAGITRCHPSESASSASQGVIFSWITHNFIII